MQLYLVCGAPGTRGHGRGRCRFRGGAAEVPRLLQRVVQEVGVLPQLCQVVLRRITPFRDNLSKYICNAKSWRAKVLVALAPKTHTGNVSRKWAGVCRLF